MLPQTSSTSSMTVEPVPPSQCRYSPHPRYPQGCLRSYRKPDEAAASATEVSPTPPNMAITTEPVTSGVTVTLIVAIFRTLWRRTRLPTGLSQRMTRRNYLAEMLVIAKNDQVDRLDALVPNLLPAYGSTVLAKIQESWTRINSR